MSELLKINGEVFPMKWLVIPSWDVNDEPIIKADYFDTEYDRHIIKAPKLKTEITFRIRQLYEDEFRSAIEYFTEEMTVEYYNIKTGQLESGVFTYKNRLTPVLDSFSNGKWLCKELTMVLIKKSEVPADEESLEYEEEENEGGE